MHWIVGTLESADAVFQKPDRAGSAHYGIGDNEIHQYVSEDDTAWANSNWNVNCRAVSIEHEGGPKLPISEATYQTSIKLVRDICSRYKIPIDRQHIIGHREVPASTQCPGNLDIDRIVKEASMSEVCIFKDNSEKKWWNGETKDAREWFDIAKYHRGQEENWKERATVAEKALQIANDSLSSTSKELQRVLTLNEELANKLAEERSTVKFLNGKIVDNGDEILRLTTERDAARKQLSSAEKELVEAHQAYTRLKEDLNDVPEAPQSPTRGILPAFENLLREIVLYVKNLGR